MIMPPTLAMGWECPCPVFSGRQRVFYYAADVVVERIFQRIFLVLVHQSGGVCDGPRWGVDGVTFTVQTVANNIVGGGGGDRLWGHLSKYGDRV